jgi:hypothetical protein
MVFVLFHGRGQFSIPGGYEDYFKGISALFWALPDPLFFLRA